MEEIATQNIMTGCASENKVQEYERGFVQPFIGAYQTHYIISLKTRLLFSSRVDIEYRFKRENKV